jgi:drug/metabolite transporter (DMT)-like permease
MSASWLMVIATFLFATMGVCVKLASAYYGTGEIVMYRGLVGAVMMAALARQRGEPLATTVPGMHLWRAVVGVSALSLWFYAIAGLPLATAVTLNYMSSVWMAMFLIGGAMFLGGSRIDVRLVLTVLAGFVGVARGVSPPHPPPISRSAAAWSAWPSRWWLGAGMRTAGSASPCWWPSACWPPPPRS